MTQQEKINRIHSFIYSFSGEEAGDIQQQPREEKKTFY